MRKLHTGSCTLLALISGLYGHAYLHVWPCKCLSFSSPRLWPVQLILEPRSFPKYCFLLIFGPISAEILRIEAKTPIKRIIDPNKIVMSKDEYLLLNLPLILGNKWRKLVELKGQKY